MSLVVCQWSLPRAGYVPGSKAGKKQIIPQGTAYWVVMHRPSRQFYWLGFQTGVQAEACVHNLLDLVEGTKRKRAMPLQTLLEWNFKPNPPLKLCRLPKEGVNHAGL